MRGPGSNLGDRWRRCRGDLFFHKHIEGSLAFLNTLAAAVAVVGKTDDRPAKFLAVDNDVEEGNRIGDRGWGSLRRKYTGMTANEDNPWPTAVGGDHSRHLELLKHNISSGGIIKCQHKRVGETISLVGGLSTGNNC